MSPTASATPAVSMAGVGAPDLAGTEVRSRRRKHARPAPVDTRVCELRVWSSWYLDSAQKASTINPDRTTTSSSPTPPKRRP